MPSFSRSGSRYRCAIQCGAGRDALLEFELSPVPVDHPRVYLLASSVDAPANGPDPAKILEAAIAGARSCAEPGTAYFIKSVGYLPNDSKHYDLHERCVRETIRHLSCGGNFLPLVAPDRSPTTE